MDNKLSFNKENRKIINAKEEFIRLENSKSIKALPIKKRIDLLFSDLVKTKRQVYMYAHSTPELTSNDVFMIESGNMLIKIAMKDFELAQEIGDRLKEVVVSPSIDPVKGIAMHFLSKLEKETGLYWNIPNLYPEKVENPNTMSYFDTLSLKLVFIED